MLDSAVKLRQCRIVMVKVALRCGSSRHGNALRASVGWNLDVANQLQNGQATVVYFNKTQKLQMQTLGLVQEFHDSPLGPQFRLIWLFFSQKQTNVPQTQFFLGGEEEDISNGKRPAQRPFLGIVLGYRRRLSLEKELGALHPAIGKVHLHA